VNETGQKSVKGLRHQELNPLPRAAKEIPMKRSILQLTALALILTTTGIANARGGNSGSKGSFSKSSSMGSSSKYNSMNSSSKYNSSKSSSYKNFSKSSSYCKPYGKCYYNGSFYCSHKCYCDCFGCYCYWYPTDNCWCLWYQPWGCYIPWSTYCTLVTPTTAVQPAFGQTATAQTPTPPAPPSGS
jgi:hypothetical protein